MERQVLVARAEWSTAREACTLACRRSTIVRCLRIAVVVGIILTAINEGEAIVDGDLHGLGWLKVVGNFVVPFLVSMRGFLSASRVLATPPPDDGDRVVVGGD